jgi:hypothetical protein
MAYMDVTLEVSQLSGWLNAVASCRVEGRACDAGGRGREPGGGRACGVVAAHKRHARGKGPTQGLGAKGTRGAHLEHAFHGRDAGGVPAQRLVERPRDLPSRKGKHKKSGDRRAGRREGVGAAAAQAACRQRTQLWRLLAGARAERTANMYLMSVTLDVSQLDMSALKSCSDEAKRLLMSVMAETSQSAMGPYAAVAVATSAMYSWAAVRREPLLVKGHTPPKPLQAEPY